jgi:hypothetical protein
MIRILFLPFITIALSWLVGTGQPESDSNTGPITYPKHLTGTFTGGFGEETCRSCHFDFDLNPEKGSLDIADIPDNISKGEKIDIEISVEREELGAAGFQLSARYKDGSQAGRFKIEDKKRIMFSEVVPDSLQYVQHSKIGSNPVGKNKNRWTVTWQAPDSISGPVLLNIAANAANGDQSEFGDYIYTEEMEMEL